MTQPLLNIIHNHHKAPELADQLCNALTRDINSHTAAHSIVTAMYAITTVAPHQQANYVRHMLYRMSPDPLVIRFVHQHQHQFAEPSMMARDDAQTLAPTTAEIVQHIPTDEPALPALLLDIEHHINEYTSSIAGSLTYHSVLDHTDRQPYIRLITECIKTTNESLYTLRDALATACRAQAWQSTHHDTTSIIDMMGRAQQPADNTYVFYVTPNNHAEPSFSQHIINSAITKLGHLFLTENEQTELHTRAIALWTETAHNLPTPRHA